MARDAFTTAVITATISKEKVAELEKVFPKVYNIGDGLNPNLVIPDHVLKEADVWYTNWIGIPGVTSLDQVPNTKAVQLSSGRSHELRRGRERLELTSNDAHDSWREHILGESTHGVQRGQEADHSVHSLW